MNLAEYASYDALGLAELVATKQVTPKELARTAVAAKDKVDGVVETVSGYMGGKVKNPTYEQVSSGATGHTEVLQVTYDPAKVKYETLLETFWLNHDPTVTDRQFCDRGSQYRPGIFTHDAEQKRLAEASKARWEKDKPFKQKILTPIEPAGEFWKAEDYHQDYYASNGKTPYCHSRVRRFGD